MKKIILSSLILVLLVSGCSLFPTSGTQVKELPPDVISIQNITVLPSTSVRERDQFSIYFDLLNQDEFNENSVTYNIYDTGLCTWTGGDPGSKNGTIDQIYPLETRQIEWNFQAPSKEEIANLRITCPIRFRFDFSYKAKSQIDLLVINSDHMKEIQRSGKTVTFSPTINVGRGPIKIYFDFGTSLPVKNNSDLTIYVKVEDKGTGLLRQINAGNFIITFPPEFTVNDDACPYFLCTDSSSGRVCTNEVIPIISKKSLDIRCSGIKTPDVNIEKTYFISAVLDYDYYVTGESDVEVKPE
ncbi:hypothetical protein A3K64_02570 [Candidatus Micrarchaeota archaeon RBG_16_36_9]|nr:MAG: hypothetical protein A3K64_02570 [Candidatus Micrarchaeota archaeon RBG_16_36_9]